MRGLRTVRISVTSRCDLDCSYCDADRALSGLVLEREEARHAVGDRELTPGEIALLAEAVGIAGASTVRLT